ncbi:NnrS family protein [Xanthobacteraceae bacterium Astr-EGSB]|uniref:NnrS family protein n=1 Tax=Astrobacterium formosum TaxID=3069710 RepID=UPI0027B1B984|nr:NnrS family protein [Xanthobacteraceae bacterium Astr-EGSB]
MSIPAISTARRSPVVLSAPFRTFFLAAAVHGLAVVAAGPLLTRLHSPEAAAAWHAHELLFGYVPAVQAGILLTATASWTGRRLIAGAPVAALLALWVAGRLAVATFGVGSLAGAAIATAFPAVLAIVLGRELVLGRRLDQVPVMAVLVVLTVALPLFHGEVAAAGRSVFAERLAIVGIMAQFMVLLGRFIPLFTRDHLAARGDALPSAFDRMDRLSIAVGLSALATWITLPVLDLPAPAAGVVMIAAGLTHFARQARWTPGRTWRDPLLFVLHLGYGALPLGFMVAGTAAIVVAPRLAFATIHVWAIGGTGLTTLALMTRATLGHTGRPLRALAGTSALYAAVIAALIARIGGVLVPSWAAVLMPFAGVCWLAAFGGFLALYGPLLIRPNAALPHPAAGRQ